MKYRLMYVSKAIQEFDSVDPILMSIITEAIRFNSCHDITGVLYYGNGFFIQCMEGEKNIIEELFYQKILKDERHHHCEILYAEHIDTCLFKQWNMKFAPLNKNIKDFFLEYHLDEFNPYLLTYQSTLPFIHTLALEPNYAA